MSKTWIHVHKADCWTPGFRNIPIVYVHGIVDTAGGIANVTNYYLAHGYGEDEIYGTTYGPTNIFNDSLKCEYVKGVGLAICKFSQELPVVSH